MKYPEYVKKYKPKGTIVKFVRDQYYVYKATSKRVPGKKYPQQVVGDLVGKIDYLGFHKSTKCLCDISNPIIREFGFSRLMMKFYDDFKCRNNLSKKDSKNLYITFLLMLSPQSYLQDEEDFEIVSQDKIISKFNMSVCQQLDAILKSTSFDRKELESLKYICSVRLGTRVIVGKLTDSQKQIIENMGIKNEFPEYY